MPKHICYVLLASENKQFEFRLSQLLEYFGSVHLLSSLIWSFQILDRDLMIVLLCERATIIHDIVSCLCLMVF